MLLPVHLLYIIYSVEQLIREHCHIDGDDLINYEGKQPETVVACVHQQSVYYRVHQQHQESLTLVTILALSFELLSIIYN